jgi:TolB-like protein/predicted Ser/Thr protein kinase
MIGQTISHYRILSKLGEGGMGVVYKAEDTKLHRAVALKFLPHDGATDEMHRRLVGEARAAASLSHPNICTVYEIDEDHAFIAMEFLEGTIAKEAVRDRPLALTRAIDIVIQAGQGLRAAHARGVVHRDIKTSNLMLTREEQVKVMDFGLAQLQDGTHITRTGGTVGTPAYMSPEQARGEKIDHRTDIWSLAVVLCELVTGQLPFRGDSEPAVIYSILHEEPALPTSLRTGVPVELDRVLRKALAKNRDERFQSVDDFLVDLRAVRNLTLLLPSARTAGSKLRRRDALIALAVSMVILLAAGTWSYLRRPSGTKLETLAVLPLKSLSRGPDDAALEIGMADTIITRLSQLGRIKVRPTSAIRKYAAADSDALAAARELNVDAVLDGTLQRDGDRLRVSVNLLHAADGSSLWAQSFDVQFAGIFDIQDQVSAQVASRLQGRLTAAESANLTRRPTTNPEAYSAYSKAMYRFSDRAVRGKDEATEQTIDLLQHAIRLDASFGLAHAQLAYAFAWTAVFLEGDATLIARAMQELSKAESLDPNLAQIHVTRSFILYSQYENFQIDEAIRELHRAQKLDPNAGVSELAGLYFHIGLENLWKTFRAQSLELDPNSQHLKVDAVYEYYLCGRADEGLAAERRYFNRGPGIHYYREKRMLKELRPLVEDAYRKNQLDPWDTGHPALLLALEGRHREAQAAAPGIIAKVRRNRSYHHAAYDMARTYALGGNAPEAVKWLRAAATAGFPCYPFFLRDSFLDPIRQHPEVTAFLAEQKVKWEARAREFQ